MWVRSADRLTSSRKSTQGASLAARLKQARTTRTLSPTHLDISTLGDMARKDAPHSAAVAFASSVFPVPEHARTHEPHTAYGCMLYRAETAMLTT